MAYNQQTFDRTRQYLRDQTLHVLDQRVPINTSQPMIVAFSIPPKPTDNYNEVFDSIFIGDQTFSRDKAKLCSMGITHVINCAQGTRPNQVSTSSAYFKDVNIKFLGIQANDVSTFNLSPKFHLAANFIHTALMKGGKVFVHCNMGVSRSATIVLAYLMIKENIPLLEAVKIVRRHREILPNDGFIKQLSILSFQLFEYKNSQ